MSASDNDWYGRGACKGSPADLFFPQVGASDAMIAKAKLVCSACVVRSTCLEHALEHSPPGIWGGTTQKERRQIRRQRKAVA